MANTYSVIIKASLDTKGVKSGSKEIGSAFDQLTKAAEKSARAQAEAFTKSGTATVAAQQKTAREVEKINAQTTKQAEAQEKIRERAAKSLADEKMRLIRREQDAFLKAETEKTAAAKAAHKAQTEYASTMSARWTAAWATIKTGALAVFAAIAAVGAGVGMAIQRAMAFDQLERSLKLVAGSAGEAQKQLARLKELARLPGLGFSQAIDASIKLQIGFQSAIKDTTKRVALAEEVIKQFSNAIALAGGGPDVFERVITQLTQMSNAGKVLMTDLRPIIQAAPALGQSLVKAFGTISPEEINALGLSSEEFMRRWVKALSTLERAPDSAANAWTNFTNAFDQALVKIGKPFLEPLTRALSAVEPLLERFGEKIGAIFAMIGQDAQTLWNNLPAATKEAFDDMLATVQYQGNTIIQWFKDNYPLMQEVVTNILNKIAEFWGSHGEEIKNIAKTTLQSVLEGAQLILQVLAGDWNKAWESLGTIVKNKGSELKNVVVFVVRLAFEAVVAQQDLIRKAGMGLGEALLDGIAAGMRKKREALLKDIAFTGVQMVQQLKNTLSIRSPSQVFFAIGVDITEGLRLGIKSGTGAVEDAVANLVRLNIPGAPKSGKGQKGARAADAMNRPGFNLLESLYKDIDQLAPVEAKTKSLAIAAELAKVKYAQLSAAVKQAIVEAAAYLDQQTIGIKGLEIFTKAMEDAVPATDAYSESLSKLAKDMAAVGATMTPAQLAQARLTALIATTTGSGAANLMDFPTNILPNAAPEPVGFMEQLRKQQADTARLTATVGNAPGMITTAQYEKIQEEMDRSQDRINDWANDVGDIFGRAVDQWDGTFKGFFRSIKEGFFDMFKRGIAELIQSTVFAGAQGILGRILGGSSSSGSGGFGSIFSGIFGGGSSSTGGFAGGPGAGGILQKFLGGGVSTPASSSSKFASLANSAFGSTGIGSGAGLAGMGASLATLGPIAMAAMAVGTTISAFKGEVHGIEALLGGGLLAFFIGNAMYRKKQEKIRNQASLDTLPAVYEILFAAQRGELTVGQAKSQWEQVHQQYLSSISGIKDSKTKRHAIMWWDNDVTPIWSQIEAAAKAGEAAKNATQAFSPTFAQGGVVPFTGNALTAIRVRPGERVDDALGFSWHVPGEDRGVDSVFTTATPGSAVRTKSQQSQFPSFAGGSMASTIARPRDVVVKADSGRLAAILSLLLDGLKTEEGGKIIVQQMTKDARTQGTDGYLGEVARGFS